MKIQHYKCDVCGDRISDPNPPVSVRLSQKADSIDLCSVCGDEIKSVIDVLLTEHEETILVPGDLAD